MSSRRDALLRNPKLLFWAKALMGLNALNAIIVLFYLHRGVTIDQIFYLSVVYSLTTLIFEIPTGYLADRFGRKKTLLLGVAFSVLGFTATFFAYGFPAFIGVFVLMSLAFSCFSGTEEALLYDSLNEVGEERDTTEQMGRLLSADHFLSLFIPSLGALIANDLTEWQFQILILMNVLGGLLAMSFLFRLIEPRHRTDVTKHETAIFSDAWKTLRTKPILLRAGLNKVCLFVAGFIAWRAYQPILTEAGLSVAALSLFYFCAKFGTILVSWNAGRLEKRFGTVRILNATAFGFLIFILIATSAHAGIVLFVTLLGSTVVNNARDPLFAKAVNRHVASHSRATTLSHLNMLKSIVDIPVLLLSGYLAQTDLRAPLLIAIALCVVALLFLRIRESDLKSLTINPDETSEATAI